jgi:hypothetical protein
MAEKRSAMLDLMNPPWAGRWPSRLRRQARFDEAGGVPHDHRRRITPRAIVLMLPPRGPLCRPRR